MVVVQNESVLFGELVAKVSKHQSDFPKAFVTTEVHTILLGELGNGMFEHCLDCIHTQWHQLFDERLPGVSVVCHEERMNLPPHLATFGEQWMGMDIELKQTSQLGVRSMTTCVQHTVQ